MLSERWEEGRFRWLVGVCLIIIQGLGFSFTLSKFLV